MVSNKQAPGPGIRARNQAAIRIGGEQGRAADSRCLSTGVRARGLSWGVPKCVRKFRLRSSRLATVGRCLCGGSTRAPGGRSSRAPGTRKRKEAERAAAALEARLARRQAGDECPDGLARLRGQVLPTVLPGQGPQNPGRVYTVFNAIDRLVKPDRLGSLTAIRLDEFAAKLRAEGKAEATIKTYLAHLKGCSAMGGKIEVDSVRPPISPKFYGHPRATEK